MKALCPQRHANNIPPAEPRQHMGYSLSIGFETFMRLIPKICFMRSSALEPGAARTHFVWRRTGLLRSGQWRRDAAWSGKDKFRKVGESQKPKGYVRVLGTLCLFLITSSLSTTSTPPRRALHRSVNLPAWSLPPLLPARPDCMRGL